MSPASVTTGPPAGAWRGHTAVLAGFLALSVVWSWPTALLSTHTLPARWFDGWPALWLIARAPYVDADLFHSASAWPIGESLARADSYVLLGLAWLLGGHVPAVVLEKLLIVLGPAINAFAAERCAGGGFGVRRPWSLLAGLAYGYSGIAATAVLEGHVYHLLNPWLPLLWWAWRRGTVPGGSAAWGLVAGLAFAAALYTTAYFGVFAAVLVVALTLADLRRGARLLPGAALIAGPAGWAYVLLFQAGGRFADAPGGPDLFLREGVNSLAGLVGLTEGADTFGHSLATPLTWLPFWLLLFAPIVLARRPGWRVWLALALAALVATLGRDLHVLPGVVELSLPLDPLSRIPGVAFFRFPIRLFWLYALCGGVVAARVLDALAEKIPARAGHALLVAAAVEAVVGVGLPWRQGAQIVGVPSAYAATPANLAVLDVYGLPADGTAGELEPWQRGLGCAYQGAHRRPILELCIGTGVQSPRETVQRWLFATLGRGDIAGPLGDIGVGALAVHLDSFRASDARYLTDALTAALAAPVSTSTDAGETVAVYLVPPTPGGEHPGLGWRSHFAPARVPPRR